MKTVNQKAWFFVLPVLLLVAFNALIPMMTVVNYAVQETFGNNVFFWSGLRWFEELLNSERFHAALGRQFLFTAIILAIEVPLGVIIALAMPRQGAWVSVCLVLMALPMLIPWNVVWRNGVDGDAKRRKFDHQTLGQHFKSSDGFNTNE